MSREKSQLLSGAGTSFEIVKAITDAVYDRGGNDEDVRRILKDKKVRGIIADALVAGQTIADKDEVLTITVNRDRSIADGVTAGMYDWANNDITDKNFSRTGPGIGASEVILVHFDKSMSTDDVLKKLEKRNLRPADLQELLAIGEQYPDKQRSFPIIALGSVWQNSRGYRYVPYLDGVGSDRELDLRWLGDDWSDVCRFAAVRKTG